MDKVSLAKEILLGLGRKVEDDDVWENPLFVEAAQEYVATYAGDFGFMLDLKRDAGTYGFRRWTPGKYRGALNCLRAEAIREAKTKEPKQNDEPASGTIVGDRSLPVGTYTAVFADGSHRTIRVKKHWVEEEAKKGTLVLQYLSGPDNESQYTGFAFLQGTTARIWRKFANNPLESALVAALRIVLRDPLKAGETYALESHNCFRCGRKLTVPVSIHRGLGPECASKWGA